MKTRLIKLISEEIICNEVTTYQKITLKRQLASVSLNQLSENLDGQTVHCIKHLTIVTVGGLIPQNHSEELERLQLCG